MNLLFPLARPRWSRRLLRPLLGAPRFLSFSNGRRIAVNLADLRGPSFHLSYGYRKPEAALATFEPAGRNLLEGALAKSGDAPVFLDVGANIGIFSFSARVQFPAITVYGFEPHPRNAECYALTAKANGWKNVHLEPKALSDQEGEVNLYLDETNSGGHSILLDNLWNNQAPTRSIRVPVTTLDSWVERKALTRLDAIKIGAQGAEAGVVRGGLRTLAEFRPSLLIEVQHEHIGEPECLLALLGSLPFAYRVRNMEGAEGSLEDLKEWAAAGLRRGILFADYFFTPA